MKSNSFQIALLVIFGVFIIFAVLIFSGLTPIGRDTAVENTEVPLTMWGTIPAESFDRIIRSTLEQGDKFLITYVEKTDKNFQPDLVDALAQGVGPDMVLAKHTDILKQSNKLLTIPLATLPERTFKTAFAGSAEVLWTNTGAIGLPLVADPIVMYWNKDMFVKAGIAQPPKTWAELQGLPEKLTIKDERGNIIQAAVAMGTSKNVRHFKEILSAQILETGAVIAKRDPATTEELPLPAIFDISSTGAASALRYYTEYSNPNLAKYSWNSAMRNSLDEFVSEKLAIYLGKASDHRIIRESNPHINYDLTVLPQIVDSKRNATYADLYVVSVVKNTKKLNPAFAVAYKLAYGKGAMVAPGIMRLPPVRLDLLSGGTADPILTPMYASSLMALNWYDLAPESTSEVFATMIENVIIGKSDTSIAVTDAESRLRELIK